MKPGIIYVKKWTEKTIGAVRYELEKKNRPCVAFCLLFVEEDGTLTFRPNIAFDPHEDHPLTWSEEEKQRIQDSLDFIMIGVGKIMKGEDFGEPEKTMH